jgi:hypothetical protein
MNMVGGERELVVRGGLVIGLWWSLLSNSQSFIRGLHAREFSFLGDLDVLVELSTSSQ